MAAGIAAARARGKPKPKPPAPLGFSSVFSSNMVLQRGPAAAAVYGTTGGEVTGGASTSGGFAAGAPVEVAVSGSASYTVAATLSPDGGAWKAVLRPGPGPEAAAAAGGGSMTITASRVMSNGTKAVAVLENIVWGDVSQFRCPPSHPTIPPSLSAPPTTPPPTHTDRMPPAMCAA